MIIIQIHKLSLNCETKANDSYIGRSGISHSNWRLICGRACQRFRVWCISVGLTNIYGRPRIYSSPVTAPHLRPSFQTTSPLTCNCPTSVAFAQEQPHQNHRDSILTHQNSPFFSLLLDSGADVMVTLADFGHLGAVCNIDHRESLVLPSLSLICFVRLEAK